MAQLRLEQRDAYLKFEFRGALMVPAGGALKLSEDRRETGQDETAIRHIRFYLERDILMSIQVFKALEKRRVRCSKVCQNLTLSFYSGYA